MLLSYDEYMEMVPEQTVKFVNEVLQYLYYYIEKKQKIEFAVNYYRAHKELIILLGILSRDEKYAMYISELEFNSNIYKIKDYHEMRNSWANLDGVDYDASAIFRDFSHIFQFYDNLPHNYYGVTPMTILLEFLKYIKKRNFTGSEFGYIFGVSSYDYNFRDVYSKLVTKITKIVEKEELAIRKDLETEILGDLSISVINYLDRASRMYDGLVAKYDKDEALVLSLLCLINNCYDNEDEVKKLKNVLERNNCKFSFDEEVNKVYGKSLNDNMNIYAIKEEYSRFFENGVCKDKEDAEITVQDIFINVLDRNVSGTILAERMISSCGYNVLDVINLLENDLSYKNYQKIELNDFYKGLDKKTIEFVEFATKTYQLIKEKDRNKDYIMIEDDLITLSLYIANHYYNGKISEFFNDNGVSYEKVMELLNLDISKEEIDNLEFDQNILINNYEKFIYDENSISSKIRIDDICNNLCDVRFCNSLILKNIFNKLSSDYNVSDNFKSQVDDHFKKITEKNNQIIINELFLEMPFEVIQFLEKTSRYYQWLEYNADLSDNDLCIFSLLINTFYSDGFDSEFWKEYKININKIKNYLDISTELWVGDKNVDMSIIRDNYQDFILGGFNENISKKDITILGIINNIFNRKLNYSIVFNEFLNKNNKSYYDFEDFSSKYNDYVLKKEVNNLLSEYKYSAQMKSFFCNSTILHNKIKEISLEGNTMLKDDNDIERIALLYSYLLKFSDHNDFIKFLNKHGITIDSIVNYCNLSELKDFDVDENKIDYELIINNYKKYMSDKTIKKIVCDGDNTIIKDIVLANNGNFEILKQEIITEKEYQPTLSERILLLVNEKITDIDLANMNSILSFGNSLSNHSKYIHDEIPKLLLSESSDSSVKTINDIINKAYVNNKVQRKKSFWERLLDIETNENEFNLSSDVIEELNISINDNISILSKELLGYDTIRKYISVYITKNKLHLEVVKNSILHLEEQLGNLNPENEDEYFEYLNVTSHLQIMKQKENRFMTSSTLMKQELFKINQMIVNHFITVNALEMARDDLMPLVGSELAISFGRNSENEALELSRNVMELFQSILTRNVDSAVYNMEKLKEIGINDETFALINKDINVYINGLEQINTFVLEEKESDLEEDNKVKKLSLS